MSAQSQQAHPNPRRPSTPNKLAGVDMKTILKRVANGEYQNAIARELGVDPSALCHHLKAFGQEHVKARETGMEVRLEKGLEAIDAAGDDLNLARVREIQLRRLEWRAEREFPHRWSQKQEIKHTGQTGPVFVVESVSSMPKRAAPSAIIDGETGEVEISD